MMCSIITSVLLSAGAGLAWCVLIMFFCMCIEHIFFKKGHRPRLTDKEIILLKGVLAGRMYLPQSAIFSNYTRYIDRLESILSKFSLKAEAQVERMESVCEDISRYSASILKPINEHVILDMGEELKSDYTLEELLDMRYPETEKGQVKRQEELLKSPVSEIDMPVVGKNIFRDDLHCKTIKDVITLMLNCGNRKDLLKMPWLGIESVHALELFMVKEGLLNIEKGVYSSDIIP